MKKLGKFKLLDENDCCLSCECGWNLKIGGHDSEDLEKIKEFLTNL